jgi:hypothetical protein
MTYDVRPMTEDDRDRAFRIFCESFHAGPPTLAGMGELSLDDRYVVTDERRVQCVLR